MMLTVFTTAWTWGHNMTQKEFVVICLKRVFHTKLYIKYLIVLMCSSVGFLWFYEYLLKVYKEGWMHTRVQYTCVHTHAYIDVHPWYILDTHISHRYVFIVQMYTYCTDTHILYSYTLFVQIHMYRYTHIVQIHTYCTDTHILYRYTLIVLIHTYCTDTHILHRYTRIVQIQYVVQTHTYCTDTHVLYRYTRIVQIHTYSVNVYWDHPGAKKMCSMWTLGLHICT